MMETANKEEFEVREWCIENFSWYTEELHGEFIDSKECKILLYPKDHLSISIEEATRPSSIKISFISSDESLIYEEVVQNPDWVEENIFLFPQGPPFDDVLSKIRMNKGRFKDSLTIKCTFAKCGSKHIYAHTTLSISNFCIRLCPKVLKKGLSQQPFSWTTFIFLLFFTELKENELIAVIENLETENVTITLKLRRNHNYHFAVHCCISLLKVDQNVLLTDVNEHIFTNGQEWAFSKLLIEKDVIEKGLTLVFNFTFITGHVEERFVSGPGIFKADRKANNLTALSQDLKNLYTEKDYSDFQIRCGEVCFPTHRNILSARSPVFKTLLNIDMKEAASGFMEITDLDAHTVSQILNFMYTGTVQDLQWESALRVYCGADKYQVDTLKERCVDFFNGNVKLCNVYDILCLAERHEDCNLRSVAHEFILRNYDDFFQSGAWKIFNENDSKLLVKTMAYLSKKKRIVSVRK